MAAILQLAAAKISNINGPLRQNQQQDLRVNTGEDFLFLSGIYPIKDTTQQSAESRMRQFFAQQGTE